MENASKALIIAGAILISILLVTLGIVMYNASKGTTDQGIKLGNTMETGTQSAVGQLGTALGVDGNADISSDDFNAQFNSVLENKQSLPLYGYQIRDLVDLVNISNEKYPNHKINIIFSSGISESSIGDNDIRPCMATKDSGYIITITIY